MLGVDESNGWKPLAECKTVGERVRSLRGGRSHDTFAEDLEVIKNRQSIIGWEKRGVGPNRRSRLALASQDAAREAGLTEADFEVPRAKTGRPAEPAGWADSVEERLEQLQSALIRAGISVDPLAGEDPQRRSEGGDTP